MQPFAFRLSLKRSKILVLIASILSAVLLSFQNCQMQSPIKFQSLNSLSSGLQSTSRGGNGDGYEGKPDGTFIRVIPGYTCKDQHETDQPAEHSLLKISSNSPASSLNPSILLTTNEPQKCAARVDSNISLSDITSSSLQSKIISLKDGLYRRIEEHKPIETSLNTPAPESWCRTPTKNASLTQETPADSSQNSSDAKTTLDIIITKTQDQSNSSTLPQVELALSQKNQGVVQQIQVLPFSVSRSVNLQKITYQQQDFSLEIAADQTQASNMHTFSARVRARVNVTNISAASTSSTSAFQEIDQQVECRLGDQFDGVIWPSPALAKLQISEFKVLSDSSSTPSRLIASARESSNEPYALYLIDLKSQTRKKISPPFASASAGVSHFIITPNEKDILYIGTHGIANSPDLYRLAVDQSKFNQLSSIRQSAGPAIPTDFVFDEFNSRVIFMEPTNKPGFPITELFLRSNTLDGQSLVKIIDEVDPLEDQARAFQFDKSSRRLHFTLGYQQARSFSSASDGTGLTALHDPVSPSSTATSSPSVMTQLYVPWYQSAQMFEPLNFLFYNGAIAGTATSMSNPAQSTLIRTNKDGTQPIALGNYHTVNSYSPDHKQISATLADVNNPGVAIMNIDGTQAWSISARQLQEIYWTPQSDSVLILMDDMMPQEQRLYLYARDGQRRILLSRPDESWVSSSIPAPGGQGVYYWAKQGIFSYLNFVSFDGQTRVRIPNTEVAGVGVSKFTFFKDSTRAVFMADRDGDGKFELYVLSLDGRALLQVNDRYVDYGGVTSFEIVNDNEIYFQTAPLNPFSASLFYWKDQ